MDEQPVSSASIFTLLLGVLLLVMISFFRKNTSQGQQAADELRDEILFRQPECSYLGDCPICCLPLPIDGETNMSQSCCSKIICYGCMYADKLRQERENKQAACPFCRTPVPKTQEEALKNEMKRVEKNDPIGLRMVAMKLYRKFDYDGAFKNYMKAAEQGDVDAHYNLSVMFYEGHGVEKDKKKELHHLEEAAIGGHPWARYNLAHHEELNGRYDRAVKHYIIAATLGDDSAIKSLRGCYKDKLVCKEDFAAALRAHQAAVDATKSPQREAAANYAANYWMNEMNSLSINATGG
mmetsp:Transcript_6638/g.10779  ORF Transcript_6638/g.10779 Transcript_6638/m.10779 type:complete len:295 (+) Transcript_6638:79-963(+)